MRWIFKVALYHLRSYFLQMVLLLVGIYWIPRFCHNQTDGFTILRIQSKLALGGEVKDMPPLDIFSQDFTYLGSGGQAYAFASSDNHYVLKFFKHHHHFLPFWQAAFPGSEKRAQKREKKRLRDFESYRLCEELLPEETGLIYVHLEKTHQLKTHVQIFDKLHIAHRIDLDSTAFILQKRAKLSYEYLDELISKRDLKKAQEALDSICNLILDRCRKGIYDEDPQIHRNVGFVNGRAILIDVGRLKRDLRRVDPEIQRSDLRKITARLKTHLEEQSPELANYLESHVESCPI